MENDRIISYSRALNEAQDICLSKYDTVFIIGLGVADPKGIFGSTLGLSDKYPDRVIDMPASENAVTGVCIGAAINGLRPIMTHQRIDFALLSMDQIINHAAKWYYMYGKQKTVPLVIRMIIGRGWGQGAQHSQNLQALFAHIPGLKVVLPSTPYDAKGMLISAVEDDFPVIFIEHRWLYNNLGHVPDGYYTVDMTKAEIVREGSDITIVSFSYMLAEAVKAAEKLEGVGIFAEVVDLRSINPIDKDTLVRSVCKTGRLLVAESAWPNVSVSSEVISIACMYCYDSLKCAPKRVTFPFCPTPTSWAMVKDYYPGEKDICDMAGDMLGIDTGNIKFDEKKFFDIPLEQYKGPY